MRLETHYAVATWTTDCCLSFITYLLLAKLNSHRIRSCTRWNQTTWASRSRFVFGNVFRARADPGPDARPEEEPVTLIARRSRSPIGGNAELEPAVVLDLDEGKLDWASILTAGNYSYRIEFNNLILLYDNNFAWHIKFAISCNCTSSKRMVRLSTENDYEVPWDGYGFWVQGPEIPGDNDEAIPFMQVERVPIVAPLNAAGYLQPSDTCIVCLTETNTHIFMPCAHFCCCESCVTDCFCN